MFPMPKKVIKHIEAICRYFLWSGKDTGSRKATMAWEKFVILDDQENFEMQRTSDA